MPRNDRVTNIEDMIDLPSMENRWFKPDDFPNNILILKDVQRKVGNRGEFFLMTCTLEGSGEQVEISTGAIQPSMVMKTWIELGKKPMRFSFKFDGQRILMSVPVENHGQQEMFADEDSAT